MSITWCDFRDGGEIETGCLAELEDKLDQPLAELATISSPEQ